MTRLLLLLLLAVAGPAGHALEALRFTFQSTTQGPAKDRPAFVTLIGRDPAGRPCRLTPQGQFVPCTAADNQVAKNGRLWCAYGIPLKAAARLDLDRGVRIAGGRAYLSVGEPVYLRVDEASGGLVEPDPANDADPNQDLVYDWIEFALDGLGFHGNTTCVDQFGLPVTLAVVDRREPARVLGPVGLAEARSALVAAWRASVPEPFRGLEVANGTRILAPAHDPRGAAGGCQELLKPYLARWWDRFRREPLVLSPKEGVFTGQVDAGGRLLFTRAGGGETAVIGAQPTPAEVFLCNGVLAQGSGVERLLGAQLAALLNRHVEDPRAWRDAAGYYRQTPCNEYARFWHRHGLDGKAYGFAYDDVNDQSTSLACSEPLEIRVSFRWD